MNVKVENLPKSQSLVTVDVEPERVVEAREEAYRRISRDVVIPGFRKGKAPRHLVERYVSADAIQDETETIVLDKAWKELRDGELKDMPLFDAPNVSVTQHNPFVFQIVLTLQPTVKLGDYSNIRIAPELVTVTDDDVKQSIDRVREQQAQWQPVEHRPVRQGDMVTVQAHGIIGAQPISVPEGYSVTIEQGANFLAPGFAMRMIDMEIGNEREFAVQLPDDLTDKTMAGASGTAFVTVQEIKERVLPELDDALAKTLGFESVEVMTDKARSSLVESREDGARNRMENKVMDEIAAVSEISFPDAMVEQQLENMVQSRTAYLKQQGIEMDLYLRVMQKTMDQFRAELRPDGERQIRNFLLVQELGRAEGVVVEDAAVHAEIDRLAATQADQEAALKELSTNTVHDRIADQLYVKQIFDRLIAKVTEGQEPVAPPTQPVTPALVDAAATEEKKDAEAETPKLIIASH